MFVKSGLEAAGVRKKFRYLWEKEGTNMPCTRLTGHLGTGVVLLISTMGLVAQEPDIDKQVNRNNLPVPCEKKQLFYLQRDPDENTVVYQLNLEDSTVDADRPVNVYWIRYAEGGTRKNLSWVQRNLAYGISHRPLGNGEYELRLAAFRERPLRLSYCNKQQKHVVYVTINNRQAILDRIFVRIDGGSVFKPNIDYIELYGRDAQSLTQVTERIKP